MPIKFVIYGSPPIEWNETIAHLIISESLLSTYSREHFVTHFWKWDDSRNLFQIFQVVQIHLPTSTAKIKSKQMPLWFFLLGKNTCRHFKFAIFCISAITVGKNLFTSHLDCKKQYLCSQFLHCDLLFRSVLFLYSCHFILTSTLNLQTVTIIVLCRRWSSRLLSNLAY